MSLESPTRKPFWIDGLEVDPAHNRVRYKDEIRTLEPLVMDVLCCLAAQPGQVLSRQAIIDAVWGVAFGGDESLTRAVSLLRKALERDEGEDLIRTVPKRGYSLNALVRDDQEPDGIALATVQPEVKRKVWGVRSLVVAALVLIAGIGLAFFYTRPQPSRVQGIVLLVKPFTTEGDAAQANLLTDDMMASLARFDQVEVRKSGEGAKPDLRRNYVYVVSAATKASGADTRLSVRLQDFATGNLLWSGNERFATTGDHDAAVSTLAAELEPAAIAAAKKAVQAKPVTLLSPYELILLGTWVPGADQEWPGPPTDQSYWVWQRAIAKDPTYALAYASLAQVMANFALFNPPSDTPEHAAQAARHAEHSLQLAPYDAGVLFQIGLYHKYSGQRPQATAAFKRVLDLEPDNLMARIELDYQEGHCTPNSAAAISRLSALNDSLPAANPAHWVLLSRMADMSLARGDYKAARDYATKSRAIVRQVWSSLTLAAADAELGNVTEARAVGLEHQAQWPALSYGQFSGLPLSRWCLGGDVTRARDAFLKLDSLTRAQPR